MYLQIFNYSFRVTAIDSLFFSSMLTTLEMTLKFSIYGELVFLEKIFISVLLMMELNGTILT